MRPINLEEIMSIVITANDEIHVLEEGKTVEIIERGFEGRWTRETNGEGVTDFFKYISSVMLGDLPDSIYLSDFVHFPDVSVFDFYGATLDKNGDNITTSIFLAYELQVWEKTFPAKNFLELLVSRLKEKYDHVHQYDDTGTEVEVYIEDISTEYDPHMSIGDYLKHVYAPIKAIESDVFKTLTEASRANIFRKLFNFPQEYSAICTQYILWFGEVLEKLGITASLSTKKIELGTLLSIEHEGGNELTAKIESLLYGYLSLPYSEYLPKDMPRDPEEKMQLLLLKNQVDQFKFNLQQIQSALEIANIKNDTLQSELRSKDADLLLLRAAQDSKLEFFKGVFAIEEFKVFGVTVNPKRAFDLIGSSSSKDA